MQCSVVLCLADRAEAGVAERVGSLGPAPASPAQAQRAQSLPTGVQVPGRGGAGGSHLRDNQVSSGQH